MDIYINKNGQQLGPFDETKIAEGLCNGQIGIDDLAWHEGLKEWVQLYSNNISKEIFDKIAHHQAKIQAEAQAKFQPQPPTQLQARAQARAQAREDAEKSKKILSVLFLVVAPILGIILFTCGLSNIESESAPGLIIFGFLCITCSFVSLMIIGGWKSDTQSLIAKSAWLQRQQMMKKLNDIRDEFNNEQ